MIQIKKNPFVIALKATSQKHSVPQRLQPSIQIILLEINTEKRFLDSPYNDLLWHSLPSKSYPWAVFPSGWMYSSEATVVSELYFWSLEFRKMLKLSVPQFSDLYDVKNSLIGIKWWTSRQRDRNQPLCRVSYQHMYFIIGCFHGYKSKSERLTCYMYVIVLVLKQQQQLSLMSSVLFTC